MRLYWKVDLQVCATGGGSVPRHREEMNTGKGFVQSPSGPLSFFANIVFSLAALKSAIVTLILLSRSANNPASVQTALISAPESSSLAWTNSSRSTSSERFMREVWILKM
jgi:hypothetical protein